MILSVFIDRKYLFPALVMLNRANSHLPKSVEFVVGTFESEFRNADEKLVEEMASQWNREVRILKIAHGELDSLGAIDDTLHFGLAAFGRLALQARIADPHFYSDVDVLTLDGVTDIICTGRPNRIECGFVPQKSALELAGFACDEQNREFYAGLIAWPGAEWRPIIEFSGGGVLKSQYSQHDQALLNQIIGESYTPLPPQLCQLDNPQRMRADLRPGIVHYFGNWKPWQLSESARWRCNQVNCYWAAWFEAEESFLAVVPDSFYPLVSSLRATARKTRSPRFSILDRFVSSIRSLPGNRVLLGITARALGSRFHIVH